MDIKGRILQSLRPRRDWLLLRLTPTARYVRNLAKKEGVEFNPIYADRWASSVTNFAGDEVKSDATDDLLVALTRSGKMTPNDMVALVIKHHKDLKRV